MGDLVDLLVVGFLIELGIDGENANHPILCLELEVVVAHLIEVEFG
jgi:hypothetical protein